MKPKKKNVSIKIFIDIRMIMYTNTKPSSKGVKKTTLKASRALHYHGQP